MLVKLIRVTVRPGHRDDYLASQAVWNAESRRAPGYLGEFVETAQGDDLHVIIFWRSRQEYEAWMERDHDRIAGLAEAEDHFERLEIEILEGDGVPPLAASEPHLLEGAEVTLWSEIYRATVALRIGVALDVFDQLRSATRTATELAPSAGGEPEVLDHVLQSLAAMGLLHRTSRGYRTTPLAERTLVTGADHYQGNMILHNSRPDLVLRALNLERAFGLPGLEESASAEVDHSGFLAAMTETAAAGQAAILQDAIDWSTVRRLIDVGGAEGPYSIALCQANPAMSALVLDLPETAPYAEHAIAEAGLSGRITFCPFDFRSGTLPRGADAVLMSNVLRGETEPSARRLVGNAFGALGSKGMIVIYDLFPRPAPGSPGLRAALFGVHLPEAANPTLETVKSWCADAGFIVDCAEYLPAALVHNGIIVGRRP